MLTLLWRATRTSSVIGFAACYFLYVVSMFGSRTRFSKCSVSGSPYFVDVESIDLFSLYVLFPHFRPRDATRGNSFFQMSSYAGANLRITNEKQKENSHEGITWSEMGKQNEQAEKVYTDRKKRIIVWYVCKILERFSITFTANGKRQAEISRLPKTREIYLVSAYILPVSHSYGASTKTREIS